MNSSPEGMLPVLRKSFSVETNIVPHISNPILIIGGDHNRQPPPPKGYLINHRLDMHELDFTKSEAAGKLAYVNYESSSLAFTKLNINGYTLTWEVKISTRPQGTLNETIKAPDEKDTPVKVANSVKNKLNNLVALSTTVMMPAGVTFAGLDMDDNGSLYSQVNYSNEGGVEIIKRQ
ncbi:hypothetical protein TWF106_004024 [Orbilia oligospora]|uniref:Uncharacterized protein n=2 Tax=Orbilia oligospora TaxID=2813651 RepID=A0A6G1M2V6_ORBOL|nr:hypothetical protein TWF788_009190 [Orbilia oligospora]KAF3199105.1 hypothetical protein TWF106_004024 [Orbilia oligospora]KAF3223826.1 hypothetical protein TWF679_000261 [Orbilia oligospora]KAF3241616.1 hypothetical protein TWF192_008909 [Orbilia oligospora]